MTRSMQRNRGRINNRSAHFAQASAQFDPDYFLRPSLAKTGLGQVKNQRESKESLPAVAVAVADSMQSNILNTTDT